jgi:hypothetical protein
MDRIVYFVGAGLTKALEAPGWPVPMMWDFVTTMADYLDDPVVLQTMVDLEKTGLYKRGSEEALSLANGSPLDIPAFRLALKNRLPENIEDLLDKSLEKSANNAALGAHQRFIYGITRLFSKVGWNIKWFPLEQFLQKQLGIPDAKHAFISFNYDLVLDRALQKLSSDLWSPDTGYGIKIPFFVTDDPTTDPPDEGWGTNSVEAIEFSTKSECRLRLVKPHGSLNWLVPLKIPYKHSAKGLGFEDGPLIVPLTPEGDIRYWPSTEKFQRVRLPGEFPKEIGVCLLPPSSAKSGTLPFLERSRELESELITNADEVMVIGWSVPQSDVDQETLIKKALEKRRRPFKSLTVVDRNAKVACSAGVRLIPIPHTAARTNVNRAAPQSKP